MKNVVFTYLFNDADILRDPLAITRNTEYIVVTDNPNVKANIWKPIVVNSDSNNDIRRYVAMTKFNPYYYVHADKYIIIDASHQITEDLSNVFMKINDNQLCVKAHPKHVSIAEEIIRWRKRNLSKTHECKINCFLDAAGDTIRNMPIFEGCFIGLSSSSCHEKFCQAILSTLSILNDNDSWFPSNQIVLSLLIHKLRLPYTIINSNYYTKRYVHKTWTQIHE